MRQTVVRVEEFIFANKNEQVIALLGGSKGLFSHFPKYFIFLFQGITALHEVTLGLDLVSVVFPRLSPLLKGEAWTDGRNPFELNRTIKYYKSVSRSLVVVGCSSDP